MPYYHVEATEGGAATTLTKPVAPRDDKFCSNYWSAGTFTAPSYIVLFASVLAVVQLLVL
jgi:hypothetical protein